FLGYRHKVTVKYTTLRSDGQWSPQQALKIRMPITTSWFGPGEGIIHDNLDNQNHPHLDNSRAHPEPIDGYTLNGPGWETLVCELKQNGALHLAGRNFTAVGPVDLFDRDWAVITDMNSLVFPHDQTLLSEKTGSIYTGTPSIWFLNEDAFAALVIEQ